MAASAGIILPGQSAANTTLPAATYLTLFALTLAYASPGPLPAYKDSNGNTHQLATLSGGGFFNVQDYGVLPGNTAATNSTNIATLIAAAPVYSTLYFPIGTYQFASAIAVGASAFIFQGAGQNASILQTTSATADIVTLTDANWYSEFRDLGFSTSVAKSAGNCITTGTAAGSGNVGINVRRCTFSGASGSLTLFNGIVYAGTNSGNITLVEGCNFSNFSGSAIYVQGNTSTPASNANIFISGCVVNGILTSGNATAGFNFLQCGSAQVCNCDVIGCTNNLLLGGGTTATSSGVFSVDCMNCYFDDSFGSCLLISGSCNVQRCDFNKCWFTTASTAGLSAIQSTNTSTLGVTGFTFTDCEVYNTYGSGATSYGFNFTGMKDVTLLGCNVAGWTNGVAITPYSAANFTGIKVIGCTIGPVGNIGANTTGIVLNAGSFAYSDIIIEANNLAGNTTPITNSASGWTSLTITPQPGLATASLPNTAAIAAFSTTATYFTPSTPIPAGALLPGTTFRITVSGLCTSTAANTSTFSFRLGTAGTTADTAVFTLAVTAATSGTNIPFKLEATFTIRSIGSGGTVWGSAFLVNGGTTGISSTVAAAGSATATAAVNTTVKNFVGISAVTSATTTTITIEEAAVEVLNAA